MTTTTFLDGRCISFLYFGLPGGFEDSGNSFSGFINYITYTGLSKLNSHFTPVWSLCHVCAIYPKFIGKMETFEADRIALKHQFSLPITNLKSKKQQPEAADVISTADLARKLFANVTKLQVKKLYEVYKEDFELFGYSPDAYYSLTLEQL